MDHGNTEVATERLQISIEGEKRASLFSIKHFPKINKKNFPGKRECWITFHLFSHNIVTNRDRRFRKLFNYCLIKEALGLGYTDREHIFSGQT